MRFERFKWSGWNRVASRASGAVELERHIREVGERDSQAKHVLIAHSHGGNIALYAMREPNVQQCVNGLVCLSTPFIQISPRQWPGGKFFPMATLVITALLLYEFIAISAMDFTHSLFAISTLAVGVPALLILIGAQSIRRYVTYIRRVTAFPSVTIPRLLIRETTECETRQDAAHLGIAAPMIAPPTRPTNAPIVAKAKYAKPSSE